MARPRIDAELQRVIKSLAAGGNTRKKIHLAVTAKAKEMGMPAPSMESVKRYSKLTEDEKKEYAVFRWPGAMEVDSLPWEATRAALDLVKHCHRWGLGRPTVRQVKWYWRVCLATPELDEAAVLQKTLLDVAVASLETLVSPQIKPKLDRGALAQRIEKELEKAIADRYTIADTLSILEVVGDEREKEKESIEYYLAYRPWHRKLSDGQDYNKAIGVIDDPEWKDRRVDKLWDPLVLFSDPDPKKLRELFERLKT